MVPLKKVRKETSRPSDSTLRTFVFTNIPGTSDPMVSPSHSCRSSSSLRLPRRHAV